MPYITKQSLIEEEGDSGRNRKIAATKTGRDDLSDYCDGVEIFELNKLPLSSRIHL